MRFSDSRGRQHAALAIPVLLAVSSRGYAGDSAFRLVGYASVGFAEGSWVADTGEGHPIAVIK